MLFIGGSHWSETVGELMLETEYIYREYCERMSPFRECIVRDWVHLESVLWETESI
jgi:hypothetical protein